MRALVATLRPRHVGTLVAAVTCLSCIEAVSPPALNRIEKSASASAQPENLYGPERFTRSTGTPQTYLRSIPTTGFDAPFTLHIRTGGASSAEVRLDGVTLLERSDFKHVDQSWVIRVLPQEVAQLEATIAGEPGAWVELTLTGVRKPTRFCPTGEDGAVEDLSDAVAATVAGGTILVCDGTHVLDAEVIDKPITLRAEHSGMAVIRDADPSPTFEVARPAILVSEVSSGTVYITDLRFEPRGRAIEASGRWDVLEIDGVTFTGRDPITASPVSSRSSTNPGARIEVRNSAFSHMWIGVFATASIELNVRRSTFENFSQGSVTHSNNGVTYSFGRVEDNVMRGCGVPGCIRFFGANGAIIGNRLEVPDGATREVGILVRRIATHPNRQPITIENNEIIGAQRLPNPLSFNAFTIANGIWFVDQPGNTNIVRGNRIRGAGSGSLFTADVIATDNVTSNVGLAFNRINSPHTVVMNRNDFSGYAALHAAPLGIGGDYRCNWWGSPLGPVSPPVNPWVALSPWATAPIAGTLTPCDVSAPPDPVVLQPVVRVCATHVAGGPPTVPDLLNAIAYVAPGGTIRLCDGTHVARNLELAFKGFTIEAEHSRQATLDAGGAGFNVSVANISPAFPFTLRGLRFVNAASANVRIGGSHGQVLIDDSEFLPPVAPSGFGAGVSVEGSSAASPTGVVVQGSRFVGGDFGVRAQNTNDVHVLTTTFENQAKWPVELHGVAAGGFRVEGNTIRGCGNNACIQVRAPDGVIRANTITIQPKLFISGIFAIGSDMHVTDNTIAGEGGTRDPLASGSWPMYSGILVRGNATVARNIISGAYSGLTFEDVGGTATDNVVSQVAFGARFTNSTIAANRNDFLAYHFAVGSWNSTANATCNWWGSIAGPQNVAFGVPGPHVTTTPFAVAPIANQPGVACP